MTFQKGHKIYKGSEKSWFKKGHKTNWESEIKDMNLHNLKEKIL